MVRSDYTDIIFVLDRSGSMQPIAADTIGGFNKFIEDQKTIPGDVTVSLYQFDNEYEAVFEGTKLVDVKLLTDKTFVPRGSTALLDAVGRTINAVGQRLRALAEDKRPGKILFVIVTDGQENSSHEFQLDKIKEMVTHQTNNYQWSFVFLGANIDAFAAASSFGIGVASTLQYTANQVGTQALYNSLSSSAKALRSGEVKCATFTEEDRKKQEDAQAGYDPGIDQHRIPPCSSETTGSSSTLLLLSKTYRIGFRQEEY